MAGKGRSVGWLERDEEGGGGDEVVARDSCGAWLAMSGSVSDLDMYSIKELKSSTFVSKRLSSR